MTDTSFVVLGVDGCRAGWLGVTWNGLTAEARLYKTFAEVLAHPAKIIAVDMPIGLPQLNGRVAESEVRKVLGKRRSSVFSTPSQASYAASTWEEACAMNLVHSHPPKKLSKQSFGLFPKIREIDALMTPLLQNRVHEVHPELTFCLMNKGQPLQFSKKTREGSKERAAVLEAQAFYLAKLVVPRLLRKDAAKDDIIDACACAWSASRILHGKAVSYPNAEIRNIRDLMMRIEA